MNIVTTITRDKRITTYKDNIKTFNFSEKLTIKTVTAYSSDPDGLPAPDKSFILVENWLVMRLQTYLSYNNNITKFTYLSQIIRY